MARLNWGVVEERFYETGVDRGVLYSGSGDGVPWNGLISVSESPSGGDSKPAYIDGYKFRNISASEEFEATIEAFSAPREFGLCEGTQSIQNGLFATQQPRRSFSLSYRTMVGSAANADAGYKIHLVYNALAGPASRSNNTLSDQAEAATLSWDLTTLPPSLTGMKPTAHWIIDSRYTPVNLLKAVEDIIYGTDVATARMPLPSELQTMFQSQGPITRTNQVTNPAFRAYTLGSNEVRRNLVLNPAYRLFGTSVVVRTNMCTNPNFSSGAITGWSPYTGVANTLVAEAAAAYSGAYGMTATCDGTNQVPRVAMTLSGVVANDKINMTARIRTAGTGWTGPQPYMILRGPKPTAGGEWVFSNNPTTLTPDAQGWYYMTCTGTVDPDNNGTFTVNIGFSNGGVNAPATCKFQVDEILIEKANASLPYFDGSTGSPANLPELTAAWVGTAHLSASTLTAAQASYGSCFKGYSRPAWRVAGAATDGTHTSRSYLNGLALNQVLILFSSDAPSAVTGDVVSGRFRIRQVPGTGDADITISPQLFAYTSGGAGLSSIKTAPNVIVPAAGTWVDVTVPGAIITQATAAQARLYVTVISTLAGRTGVIETSNVLVEKAGGPRPWFDGNTPDTAIYDYGWAGAADTTASTAQAPFPTGWATSIVPADSGEVWVDKINALAYIWTGGLSTYTLLRSPQVAAIGQTSPGCRVVTRITSDTDTIINTWAEFGGGSTGRAMVSFTLTAGVPLDIDQVYLNNLVPGAGATGQWYVGWHPPVATPAVPVQLTIEPILIAALGDAGPYFDGSTPDADANWYSWTGAVELSSSILNTWN